MQQRYVLAVMSSLAIIGIYMSRIVLYISITQMVKPPIETIGSTAVKNDFSCPMPNQNGSAAIGSHLMVQFFFLEITKLGWTILLIETHFICSQIQCTNTIGPKRFRAIFYHHFMWATF